MTLVQIILIAVIFLVIAGAGFAFVANSEAEKKKRAIGMIKGQMATENKTSEKDEQNKRRAEIASKLKQAKTGDGKESGNKKTPMSQKLGQAGLKMTVKKFWVLSVLSMVAGLAVGKFMGLSSIALVLVAITGLLGVPRFVLGFIIRRRQKKFLEEFADALEAMVRLLKAGMPISEAVSMISREFTGPVGEEMSRVYDKQKIGIPLHEAALEATKRMPLTEVQMFATGLAIQAQTGSSLSEILSNLAHVIRARFKLKRKIKALSSEAIASASIIGALPNLVALGMYFANRQYIMTLFSSGPPYWFGFPAGNVLLVMAVSWMMMGILVMKIMINFKI